MNGTIQGNVISWNTALDWGGGFCRCTGVVCDNIISGNVARDGGALDQCSAVVEANVITGNSARETGGALRSCFGPIRNNTIHGNSAGATGGGLTYCDGLVRNCVIWANAPDQIFRSDQPVYSCVQDWTEGGEGNISEEPRFAEPEGPDNNPYTYLDNDYRLLPDSPCIDAGFNDAELPEFDIAGMHRIMFGGKSLTVDIGAYEFYINKLQPVPGSNEAIFTWSSLADKSYSIFYTDDLFNWHTAIAALPSSGSQTTSWLDDGSLTGLPPLLAPRRFYRLLENP